MKKIFAFQELSILQKIFINLQINLSKTEKCKEKQDLSFELGLEKTHAAKSKQKK